MVTRYVGLLKAVNLPGHNKVKMAALCAMAADAGMMDPRSLLASGNLVFGSAETDASAVERQLEQHAKAKLGLDTAFLVRSASDWARIIAGNPFHLEAERDPGHLLVLVLRDAPARAAAAALSEWIPGREVVQVNGRVAYAVYPDGIGNSKLTTAVIERKLGTQCTGRNWNTVQKLGAML